MQHAEELNRIKTELLGGPADDLLRDGSESEEFLSKDVVERMSKICSKRRLNARDKKTLMQMNMNLALFSEDASPDVFRQHVEQSTVKAWLDHVIEQIKRCSRNRNWITTGNLADHDTSLLLSCAAMMDHAVPVALAFESEFFTVLADLVKARKGTGRALPSADICEKLTFIVSSAYVVSRTKFDNKWTTEKAFKKLDATGVLEQFIRCVTVPQEDESCAAGMFAMLNEFQACVPFIKKEVRPGQPCGDVVIAILEGKDGSRVERPSIINKLKTMIRFASSIDQVHNCRTGMKECNNCCKVDNSEALMKCGRCQVAYYCSKECQKADWKSHKKGCVPLTKKQLLWNETAGQTLQAFATRQYVNIMVKMVEACQQTGLSKDDMLVEVDFTANENGIVPAMKEKPEFKIAPVKDYMEGSRPAEPDWFDKMNRENYEYNIKVYLAAMKEGIRQIQPNQFSYLVRFEGRTFWRRTATTDPTTHKELFSQETVLAFQAYMGDGDDGPLSKIYPPERLVFLKLDLAKVHGYCGRHDIKSLFMDAIRFCQERQIPIPNRLLDDFRKLG